MGVSNLRSVSLTQNAFSRSELLTLIPSTPEPALFNYLNSGLNQGLTKNQLLSASRYLEYIQGQGWSTYSSGGIYYAYKRYLGSENNISFNLFAGNSIKVLIVAGGGGGGGSYRAGGGGAGGLIYSDSVSITPGQTYNFVVGGGGAPGNANTSGGIVNGSPGGNSSAFGLTAIGGGGGGSSDSSQAGGVGGSGGGGWYNGTFGNGTTGQGNRGGVPSTSAPYGSGGGGAGAVGGNAQGGQRGGDGLQYNLNSGLTIGGASQIITKSSIYTSLVVYH